MQIFPDVAFVSLAMLQVAVGLLGCKAPPDTSSSQIPPSTASADAQDFRWQTHSPLLWKFPREEAARGRLFLKEGHAEPFTLVQLLSSHLWGVRAPASKALEAQHHLPRVQYKVSNEWQVNELNA